MNTPLLYLKLWVKPILIIVILFNSLTANSQNINQLESQLENVEGAERAMVRLELSQAYLLKKDYLKAYTYAEDGAEYFKNNDKDNFHIAQELLGDISFEQMKYKQTITHLEGVYEYYNRKQDNKNAGFVASKIGSAFERLNNYNQAVNWYKKGSINFTKSKSIREMIISQSNLGGVYSNFGDYKSAETALNTAYQLALKHGSTNEVITLKERLKIVAQNIESNKTSTTDFARDQAKKQNQKISDIISQRAKTLEEIEKLSEEKQLVELKIRVQQDGFEKKILSEKLAKLKIEEDLKQEKLEKSNLILALDNERLLSEKKTVMLVSLILVVILILLALIIKNRSNKKLAMKNCEIKRQKSEILEKQENINQSIVYATRIQEAILPSPRKLLSNFSDAFVYLNPKDQVSGDFLWTHKRGTKFFVCVADCTGHGVPGAFMSIIFNNILDEIIKKEKIVDPSQILERSSILLYEKVKEQGRNLSTFKDGMDAIILTIDSSANKAVFCGAKNGLIFIRDNQLKEYKGIRKSIDITSINQDSKTHFSSEDIDIQPDDVFYLSTDGFVDQKGGENNTKFYRAPFRNLLLEISNKTMNEQREILHSTFLEWKNTTEQIDDVLIVGIKI